VSSSSEPPEVSFSFSVTETVPVAVLDPLTVLITSVVSVSVVSSPSLSTSFVKVAVPVTVLVGVSVCVVESVFAVSTSESSADFFPVSFHQKIHFQFWKKKLRLVLKMKKK